MPKLKDTIIQFKDTTGKYVKYAIPTTVNAEGLFSFRVPDELYANVYKVKHTNEITHSRERGFSYIFSNSLAGGQNHVTELAKFTHSFTETRETVILYKRDGNISYLTITTDPTNTPYLNGSHADFCRGERTDDNYKWNEYNLKNRLHVVGKQDNLLGFEAVVVDRITLTRGELTEVFYEGIRRSDDSNYKALGVYGKLLTDINTYGKETAETTKQRGWAEMPYTETAAEFCLNIMDAIIKLAAKLTNFFDQPQEQLIDFINKAKGNLLTFGSNNDDRTQPRTNTQIRDGGVDESTITPKPADQHNTAAACTGTTDND